MDKIEDILQIRIDNWIKEAIAYRWLNIILFIFTKIGVPLISTIVATSLLLATNGTNIINESTVIWLSIVVVILSGLDTIINPGKKKVLGFENYNRLCNLKEELAFAITLTDENKKNESVMKISNKFKEIQDNYAKNGWGS